MSGNWSRALILVCFALLFASSLQTTTIPVPTTTPEVTTSTAPGPTTTPAITSSSTASTVATSTTPGTTTPAMTTSTTPGTTSTPVPETTTTPVPTTTTTIGTTTKPVPVTTTTPVPVTTTTPVAGTTTAPLPATISSEETSETSTHNPSSEGTTNDFTGSGSGSSQTHDATSDTPTGSSTDEPGTGGASSTDESSGGPSTDSGSSGSSTTELLLNYCPQLYPECSCFTSPIVVKCDNFDRFSQLNFRKLINENNETYNVYELEISPKKPIMLDAELDLTGISHTYLSQVELRNINGFDYFANPFEDFKAVNKNLRLFIYDSFIQFYLTGSPTTKAAIPVTGVHCDLRLVEGNEGFHPILSSFDFISLPTDVNWPEKLCPLAFRNAEIRLLQFFGLKAGASIAFEPLNTNSKAVTGLNSKITNVNIYLTNDLTLSASFLDKDVFENLYQLNIEGTTMKSIEEDAFKYLNNLRRVILFLNNFATFIRSTADNPWMANLNGNIRVNLSNPAEVEANKNKQMIITFNDRVANQNYDWPDRDIRYFVNFPHDKLVFPRVIANVDINKCTFSLSWLYLYRQLAVNQADINTTSASNCLLDQPATIPPSSTIRTTVEAVTRPDDPNLKFTNTQFYVTLGVLLGAVVVLFVLVVMLCVKYKNLKSDVSRVDDNYSLKRF